MKKSFCEFVLAMEPANAGAPAAAAIGDAPARAEGA